MGRHQRRHGRAGQQRGVPGDHDHQLVRPDAHSRLQCDPDRVSRAALGILHDRRHLRSASGDRRDHPLPGMPDHHELSLCTERRHSGKNMVKEGSTRDTVQHFGDG